ncbi:hypothetical protein CEE37_05300 [candidate division LCP-89 bacterium B3_LCP]|uniref:Uncharacterized protein n=1 Tax=candidate division LCP-89 bacterium B3_LCP TaxID=2012998 RepID=A0A532V1J4_UNCL8|nr:MAG: hypothetical protein CEE37_05300 [candidate division LCP-89 bacterium B3_LCP]
MIHQTLSGPLVRDADIPTNEDVRIINSLKNPPPVPVSEKDIFMRHCRLAGDSIDGYFGCFRTEDLPKLLSMVQGAPLLIGHNKRSLGVARFFGGTIEEHDGSKYIVPSFYWLRGHSSADDLRVAIDGGLYSEASISFAYEKPTCSVCGEDIRTCEHLPGSAHGDDGNPVFYYYDNVVAVLEGSLVYRGAQPGTGFSLSSMLSDSENPTYGTPILRIKRHGKWYRAPLIEENPDSEPPVTQPSQPASV